MWRALSIIYIASEGAKFIFKPSKRHFHEVVLERVENDAVPRKMRPFLLAFVMLGRLRNRTYEAALALMKQHWDELPWANASGALLRRVFELSIIFGEQRLADASLTELTTRPNLRPSDVEALRTLQAWRAGILKDEARIDLERTYFSAFPAYDEWFKGQVLANAGLQSHAKEHFRRCLDLPLLMRKSCAGTS